MVLYLDDIYLSGLWMILNLRFVCGWDDLMALAFAYGSQTRCCMAFGISGPKEFSVLFALGSLFGLVVVAGYCFVFLCR